MAQKNNTTGYNQLNQQLNEILEWFESEDFDIEKAEGKYKKALELINEIQQKLTKIENQIIKLSIEK